MSLLKTKMLNHQHRAIEKVGSLKVGALFMDMGTGKSRTVLELLSLKKGKYKKAIWFTPLSALSNTASEIVKHSNFSFQEIENYRQEIKDVDIYLIGYQSLSGSSGLRLKLQDLDFFRDSFLIYDESHLLKNCNTVRFKYLSHFRHVAKYRFLLTGTPATETIANFYSQFTLLDQRILGYYTYGQFERSHIAYNEYTNMPYDVNKEYILERIEPFVFQVEKSECLDLPPKIYTDRSFYLTSDQQEIYHGVKYAILDKYQDYTGDALIYQLICYLRQISNGFCNYYDEDSGIDLRYEFDENPRLEVLKEYLQSKDDQVVIWANYKFDHEALKEFLGGKASLFTGALKNKERQVELDNFRKEKTQYLIINPQCGAAGLDLSFCDEVVFYNSSYSYTQRMQAEDRCYRLGQDMTVVYCDLKSNAKIDQRIFQSLERKQGLVSFLKEKLQDLNSKKKLTKEQVEELKGLV